MSAESIKTCAINYYGQALIPNLGNGEETFLSLPQDLIWRIMKTLGDEISPLKGAINLVDFGRVCKRMHWMTHEDSEVDALLHDEEKFKPFIDVFPQIVQHGPYTTRRMFRDGVDLRTFHDMYVKERQDFYARNNTILESWGTYEPVWKKFLLEDAANERNLSQVFHAIFKKVYNVQETSRYISRSKEIAENVLSPNEASRQLFSSRIYHDLIDYRVRSSNPIKNNIKEYKDLVALLKKDYPEIPASTHEKHLRQALCRKYKNQLEAARDACANPSEELLTKVKDMLKEDRKMKLSRLSLVASQYRGTSGSNGVISDFEIDLQNVESRMRKAKETYLLDLEEHRKFVCDSIDADDLFNSEERTHSRFTNFLSLAQEYKKVKGQLYSMKQELEKIGVWDENQIQTKGPKYIEIEESFQEPKLTEDARSECARISAFFDELTKPIDDQNEEEMFQLLHGIIG